MRELDDSWVAVSVTVIIGSIISGLCIHIIHYNLLWNFVGVILAAILAFIISKTYFI